eukprot:TRINITY_DN55017_c0_g1_i5.p2 TRINITY_DN55017_c0_g1~~TRINITY_DN55017_c0_g1_i5.p2  ORF type:complete len:487 (+),score=91.71 TRINITY_DN55017_c0_g1_i5:315-1775(+)
MFKNHLCMVFEILDINLFELIKQNRYRGLGWKLIKTFTSQILKALSLLRESRIIHCDLKPENVLLVKSDVAQVKVVDFGSACMEEETTYSYIQSRFYRSPEILLGLPYSSAIDMWSVGCICAELFLGLPIFPGCNEYDQVARIVEMLGNPPLHMLSSGRNVYKFFDHFENGDPMRSGMTFSIKSQEQYIDENHLEPYTSKKYFKGPSLEETIFQYPVQTKDRKREKYYRKMFADFLSGLLKMDPAERWTPWQALKHPFLTGAEFDGPYVPDPDPRTVLAAEFGFSHNAESSIARSVPIPGRRESAPNPYVNDFSLSGSNPNSMFYYRSPFGSLGGDSFSFKQEHSSLQSKSIPRSDPKSIPIPASNNRAEFSVHRTAYSSGDVDQSIPMSFSGSFSNTPQFSYHSPYTYGDAISRTTNYPADYSWADPSQLMTFHPQDPGLNFTSNVGSIQRMSGSQLPVSGSWTNSIGRNYTEDDQKTRRDPTQK